MDSHASGITSPVLTGPSSLQHAIYKPLDESQREFRLVQLHPGSGSDVVNATLLIATLRKGPPFLKTKTRARPRPSTPYEAISYTWDETSQRATMVLDGFPVLTPASAVEVLKAFRTATMTRVVWIDAVSINQQDLDERASQVAMMGDIYEASSQTIAWLGNEDEYTAAAIELTSEISQRIKEIPSDDPKFLLINQVQDLSRTRRSSKAERVLLYSILDRRWFTRAWVLQEAVLAPSCICHIGSLSVEWRALLAVACWLDDATDKEEELLPHAVQASAAVVFLVAYLEDLATYRCSLGSLMEATMLLRASDARDKIYSLLGMVEWIDGQVWGPATLQPDYRTSFRRCIGNAVRVAIFEGNLEDDSATEFMLNSAFDIEEETDTDAAPWPS